jgi:hypothetical protein
MAEVIRPRNHYQSTGPQETGRVLPNCAMQNGSTGEASCSRHEITDGRNNVSSEDSPTLEHVSVTDRNNTNKMRLTRVEDELQPLGAEEEPVLQVTVILARI